MYKSNFNKTTLKKHLNLSDTKKVFGKFPGVIGNVPEVINKQILLPPPSVPQKQQEYTAIPSQSCSFTFNTYSGKWKNYLPECLARILGVFLDSSQQSWTFYFTLASLTLDLLSSSPSCIWSQKTYSKMQIWSYHPNENPLGSPTLSLSATTTTSKLVWPCIPHEQKLLTCTPNLCIIYISYTGIPVLVYYITYTKIEI